MIAAGDGDRIVVTSVNAGRSIVDAAARVAVDPRRFAWAAVGEASATALAAAGVADVFVPSRPDGDTLAAELPLVPGDRIILPRTDIADEALPDALRARGAVVTSVVAYATIEAPAASGSRLVAALDDGPVDAIVVTSGSAARGVLTLASDDAIRIRLLAAPVVAIGEPSAAAARELGFPVVLVAPSPDPAGLASFVARSLGVRPRTGSPARTPLSPGGDR
jgi:uroporphyrinogen-III synthase